MDVQQAQNRKFVFGNRGLPPRCAPSRRFCAKAVEVSPDLRVEWSALRRFDAVHFEISIAYSRPCPRSDKN